MIQAIKNKNKADFRNKILEQQQLQAKLGYSILNIFYLLLIFSPI
jgi:hypothetical protein